MAFTHGGWTYEQRISEAADRIDKQLALIRKLEIEDRDTERLQIAESPS